jgi:hypothetical protein
MEFTENEEKILEVIKELILCKIQLFQQKGQLPDCYSDWLADFAVKLAPQENSFFHPELMSEKEYEQEISDFCTAIALLSFRPGGVKMLGGYHFEAKL